jgi:hypothetical protein
MPHKPRIGDVFEIPLSGERYAFGQYLNYSRMGPIIQVFAFTSEQQAPVNIAQIIQSKPLFPPIITGLFAAVRDGMWKVIGNKPVNDFVHPKFLSALYDERTGDVKKWSIWDGDKSLVLGKELPREYKGLEYLVVWSPINVVSRIETGKVPFPYYDMIRYNKFVPRGSTH